MDASTIEFNTDAVQSWVALCRDEAAMRAQNASESELAVKRVEVVLSMVNLLPTLTTEEKMNLALVLLVCEPPVVTEPVAEDPTTTQEPVSPSSQTTEQVDPPSRALP